MYSYSVPRYSFQLKFRNCFRSFDISYRYLFPSSFLFPMAAPGFPQSVRTDLQRATQLRIIQLFVSFATAGVPLISAAAVGDDEGPVCWRPVDAKGEYLDIGPSLVMKRETEFERQIRFWNRIKAEQRPREAKLSDRPVSELHSRIAVRRLQN
jgi:hypothetical protein